MNITGNAAYLTVWSYNTYPTAYDKNSVLISVDGAAFTQIWSPNSVSQSWVPTTIDLTSYIGHDIVFGFKYEGDNAHGWYLDDVSIIADYHNILVTEGNWNTAANWITGALPTNTNNILINANVTIPNGTTAEANNITVADGKTITIADGGQLITNTAVTATVEKVIDEVADWTINAGWHFIASPITTAVDPEAAGLITDDLGSTATNTNATYDLYRLDGTNWKNYRNEAFTMTNGTGYLYANHDDVTPAFVGDVKPFAATLDVTVSQGWNLIGNPFTYNVYLNHDYYKMNNDGTGFVSVTAGTEDIAPCTGVVVEADADGTVTFSKNKPSSGGAKGSLNIALTEAGTQGKVIDNAIVSFGDSRLGKFYFGTQSANIFIPVDGKEFAIASSEANGEMPVNFKAATNGTYTLLFNTEGVTMGYLHLIDNLTGNDVDLLANPSYTFDARHDDYAARFKLVFSAQDGNDDSFAFVSNGEIILTGVDGKTIAQVFDITGRMISSANASNRLSTEGMAAGVYVLRLINGDNVKTQKIVVK